MAHPILNKPYTPWHATDVREAFALERQRLVADQADQADRLNAAFGASLGRALAQLARPAPAGAAKLGSPA